MSRPAPRPGRPEKVSAPRRQATERSMRPSKPRPRKAPGAPLATTPAAAAAGGSEALFDRIVTILEEARGRAVRAVNSQMVLAYWHIGREIVQQVQSGLARAEYGEALLETLSRRLTERYGKGFSATNLRYFRLFYQAYSERSPEIHHEPRDESASRRVTTTAAAPGGPGKKRRPAEETLASLSLAVKQPDPLRGFASSLSWTHYRTLTKVEHPAARRFYEIEAEKEGWSAPHLERQIHTHLFARLLKSRDKAGVMELASRGQILEKPVDSLRDPYVLDFLGLPDGKLLRESDLESAIIEKLQSFLLELGKGFAFVARQKRIAFEDEHFYIDLVFYNCILKCYLLIDLKLGKLTLQDVGQMDGYVRMFDDQCTTEGDSPTIGLILCAEKNEAVARYSVLHESRQLFAAKYVTYLPTVEELQQEVRRERRLIEGRTAGTRGR